MNAQTKRTRGAAFLDEMREFASFKAATQRYIRRSLDIGLGRREAQRRWARDRLEAESIREQAIVYRRLDLVRDALRQGQDLMPMESLIGPLTTVASFDLAQGGIDGFNAFRFLYERLVGAALRPFLPAAFCAAATLPYLHPLTRRDLLRSLDETVVTSPGWAAREPVFMPEWVEKVEVAIV